MENPAQANSRRGKCYQIALAIIEIGSEALILVHGRVAGIEHAWIVADDGRIYDPVAHALIDAADYPACSTRVVNIDQTASPKRVSAVTMAHPPFTSNVEVSQLQKGRPMRNLFSVSSLLGLLAVSAIAIATPVVPASAQGVIVDTPVGGVRVGRDRDYDRHRYSDYDRPQYRSYARDCRTITIRRDDGSVRRVRRCD